MGRFRYFQAALVVALIVLATAAAVAAPVIRIGDREFRNVRPAPVIVDGHVMWGIRPLVTELGGTVEAGDDWLVVHREGSTLRLRPGDRRWYVDNKPHYFTLAPIARGGYVYVPVSEFVSVLGGAFEWNAARQMGNINFGEERREMPTSVKQGDPPGDPPGERGERGERGFFGGERGERGFGEPGERFRFEPEQRFYYNYPRHREEEEEEEELGFPQVLPFGSPYMYPYNNPYSSPYYYYPPDYSRIVIPFHL